MLKMKNNLPDKCLPKKMHDEAKLLEKMSEIASTRLKKQISKGKMLSILAFIFEKSSIHGLLLKKKQRI